MTYERPHGCGLVLFEKFTSAGEIGAVQTQLKELHYLIRIKVSSVLPAVVLFQPLPDDPSRFLCGMLVKGALTSKDTSFWEGCTSKPLIF